MFVITVKVIELFYKVTLFFHGITSLSMPKISDEDMAKGEKELKRVKAVIQSMTIEERRHPEILKASRKIRIAKGCAMQVSDVNYVLKKHEQMKQMMKQMKSQMGRFGRPM